MKREDIIDSYTRVEAIDDGVLIDVSTTAHEAGIRFPVALTCAVWSDYVAVPDGVNGQDEAGRLWDILWMLRCAIGRAKEGTRALVYCLHVRNDNHRPRLVTLKAHCGPDDDGKPCITVMMPSED